MQGILGVVLFLFLLSLLDFDQIPYLIFLLAAGLRVNGELITAYPQVVVVRVPTPWVQSDSDITVLRHLEKMGCRLMNRPQAILNCVNKFWTFQELAGHGVPLPDTFSYGKSQVEIMLLFIVSVHLQPVRCQY